MDPETHRALHRIRAAELHAQAAAHRLAARTRQPYDIRSRLGWTLVELGLRLATPRPPALAH
ncbi:hypothetical protein [Streptomyces sp. NBC_01092]|uniref:hypothetical protein n=1 Tax=Streptomyces sp. NBC_01092 TaxID=2903748 RepID=UPI00386C9E63|nr:hypothetical protein OG254_19160 [Streptomyces sp. NBC_01092]